MADLTANYNLDAAQAVDLLILVMAGSGVFGFIYEEIFYYFDLGRFVKRGSTFGPWIPIYFFGGAVYALLVYPFRESPLAVFFMCVIASGIMELVTGFVLDKVFHIRLWDYNKEIANFGNINGYICLRSVVFFGASGLLLVYLVIPLLARIVQYVPSNILHPVCIVIALLFVIDVIAFKVVKGMGNPYS